MSFIPDHDWKKEAKSGAKSIYLSMRKAVDIPALVADLLDGYMKGQTRINLDLHAGEDLAELVAPRHEKCGHGSLGHGATY